METFKLRFKGTEEVNKPLSFQDMYYYTITMHDLHKSFLESRDKILLPIHEDQVEAFQTFAEKGWINSGTSFDLIQDSTAKENYRQFYPKYTIVFLADVGDSLSYVNITEEGLRFDFDTVTKDGESIPSIYVPFGTTPPEKTVEFFIEIVKGCYNSLLEM